MDNGLNEDSYIERRQLFKNIWDTAMNIDEKDDIMSKPKVIKTLRLDEVDKCIVGKKKKQRIKNLRHVCKRILDFCDRQDADDMFYEQMAADGQEPGEAPRQIEHKSPKKIKIRKVRKKVKKVKSLYVPLINSTRVKTTVSEGKDDHPNGARVKTLTKDTQIHAKRTVTAKIIKSKTGPKKASGAGNTIGDTNYEFTKQRKTVKKRHKKKASNFNVISTPQGKLDAYWK